MNIKNLCSLRNITFKELSRRVNKSEQGLYKSLLTNSINIKTLADIADVLEVCISELISDSRYKFEIEKYRKNDIGALKITDANEYMVSRFEEVVRENGELREKLKNYESLSREGYTMQNVPPLKVAEGTEKLKTQIDK